MAVPPFHLAIPVPDLEAARAFYGGVCGCPEGRSSDRWIDFDFFGHQLVVHLVDEADAGPVATNPVAGHDVPVRHFGVVVDWETFPAVQGQLEAAGIPYLVPPHRRFEGEPGEQVTLFVSDPAGHAIEFKSFRDPGQLFAR